MPATGPPSNEPPELHDPPAHDDRDDPLVLDGITLIHRSGLFRRAYTSLHDVHLRVPRGARMGLIGPNGSGKSSLLRIAAGVQRPSAGTVRIYGRSVEDARSRRRVGYLADGSPFPPELSARSVLELFHAMFGLERATRREHCDQLLERTGLGSVKTRSLGSFSRGMLRRFGLAQAFLHEPDLILLDEPTAGLDAQGHMVLEEFLEEARARGAALLLASHVPNDLLAFSEHVFVLAGGRILHEGRSQALLKGVHGGRSMAELFQTKAAASTPPPGSGSTP